MNVDNETFDLKLRVNNRPNTSQNIRVTYKNKFKKQTAISNEKSRTASYLGAFLQNVQYHTKNASYAISNKQSPSQPNHRPMGFRTQQRSPKDLFIDDQDAYEAYLNEKRTMKPSHNENRDRMSNIDLQKLSMQPSPQIMAFSSQVIYPSNINQNGGIEQVNQQFNKQNLKYNYNGDITNISKDSYVMKFDGDQSFLVETNGSRSSKIKSRLDKLNRQRHDSSFEIPDETTYDDQNVKVITDKSFTDLFPLQMNQPNLNSNLSKSFSIPAKPTLLKRRSQARQGSVLGEPSGDFISSVLASSPNRQQRRSSNFCKERINVPSFNQQRNESQSKIINFHKIYQSQKNYFADDIHIVKQQPQNLKSGKIRRNIQMSKKSQEIKMLQQEIRFLRQRQSLKDLKFEQLAQKINTFMENEELLKSMASQVPLAKEPSQPRKDLKIISATNIDQNRTSPLNFQSPPNQQHFESQAINSQARTPQNQVKDKFQVLKNSFVDNAQHKSSQDKSSQMISNNDLLDSHVKNEDQKIIHVVKSPPSNIEPDQTDQSNQDSQVVASNMQVILPIQQNDQEKSPRPPKSNRTLPNEQLNQPANQPDIDQSQILRMQVENQSQEQQEALNPISSQLSQSKEILHIKTDPTESNQELQPSQQSIKNEQQLNEFVQDMKLKLQSIKGDQKSINRVQKALNSIRIQTEESEKRTSNQSNFLGHKIYPIQDSQNVLSSSLLDHQNTADQSQIQNKSATISFKFAELTPNLFEENKIHIEFENPGKSSLKMDHLDIQERKSLSSGQPDSQTSQQSGAQTPETPETPTSASQSGTDSELDRNIKLQVQRIIDLQQQQQMPYSLIKSSAQRRKETRRGTILPTKSQNWPLRKMKSLSIKQTFLEEQVDLLERQGLEKKQLLFSPKIDFDLAQDYFECHPKDEKQPEVKEKLVKKTFMKQVYEKWREDHQHNQKQEAINTCYINMIESFEKIAKHNFSRKNPLSMYWDDHRHSIKLSVELIHMVHIINHLLSTECCQGRSSIAKMLKVDVTSYKRDLLGSRKLVELIHLHKSNFEDRSKLTFKRINKIKQYRQLEAFPTEVPIKIPIMTMLIDQTHMQFSIQYLEIWMEDRFRIQKKIMYFRQIVEKQKNKLIESEKHFTLYCMQTDLSLNFKLNDKIVFIDLKNGLELDKAERNITLFDLKTKAYFYNVYEQIDWRQVEYKTLCLQVKQDKMTQLISAPNQQRMNLQLVKIIGSSAVFGLSLQPSIFSRIPEDCTQSLLIKFRKELRLSPVVMKEKTGIANQHLIKHINKQYQMNSFDRHIEYINLHKPKKDIANLEQEIVNVKQFQNFRESTAYIVACKNAQYSFYKLMFSADIQKVSNHLLNPSDDVIMYTTVLKITNDFNKKFSKAKQSQEEDAKLLNQQIEWTRTSCSNSMDLIPHQKLKHDFQGYELGQDMRYELQRRQSNSMVDLGALRAVNVYQRQQAEDKYNKDHIIRFIQQELDDRSLMVKDSVNFMTKDLQSYIFYEDSDLNLIAKRHCYKVQFVRDSSRKHLMEIFKPINVRKGKLKQSIQKMIKIREQTQNASMFAKNKITLSNLKKNQHKYNSKKVHKHIFHTKDRIHDMFEANSFRTDESMDKLDVKEVMDILEMQENPITQFEAKTGGQSQPENKKASQVQAQKAILNFMSNNKHPIVHYSKLKRERDKEEKKQKREKKMQKRKSVNRRVQIIPSNRQSVSPSSFKSSVSGQSKNSTKIFSKLFGTKLKDKKPMVYGVVTQAEIIEQQAKDTSENASKWNMEKMIRRETKNVDAQYFEELKDLQEKIDNLNEQINDPEADFQAQILYKEKEKITAEYNKVVEQLMNVRLKKISKEKERKRRKDEVKMKSDDLDYFEKHHYLKQNQYITYQELVQQMREQDDAEEASDDELELLNEIGLLEKLKLHSQEVDLKKAERMKRRIQILNKLHNQKEPISIKKTQVVKFESNRKNKSELKLAISIQTQLKKEKFQRKLKRLVYVTECKKRGVSEDNIKHSPWTEFRHLKLPEMDEEESQEKNEKFQIGGKIIESENRSIDSGIDGKKQMDRERLRIKFLNAVSTNNWRLMLEMLQRYQGPFDNIFDEDGNGLVSCAAKYGHSEMVKLLLVRGFDPNTQDKLGNTSLHYAVSANFRKIVDLLIQHGAQENINNNDGFAPWEMGLQ